MHRSRFLQFSAAVPAGAADDSHQRFPGQALLPAHGHHEQAHLRRHHHALAQKTCAVCFPVHLSLTTLAWQQQVLVFVSSRRQTRLTAQDLIQFSVQDPNGNSRKWLHMTDDELKYTMAKVKGLMFSLFSC